MSKLLIMRQLRCILIPIIFVLIFVSSCTMSIPEPDAKIADVDYGDNIIDKDDLESLIYDVHLVDAMFITQNLVHKSAAADSLVYQKIFDKYDCSQADFEATLRYYVYNRFDTLNAIYDRVLIRFSSEKSNID